MGDADKLLSDLNDRQREAVTTLASPLAILAGAGSGKTRVLTRRIAWLAAEGVLDARHVLALTFTRKAAGELSDRLGKLGVRRAVTSGTFHGLALAQLRRRWLDRGEAVPALLERKSRILAPLLGGGPSVGAEAAEVAGEIEWAKARLIVPEGYEAAVAAAGRATPRPAGEIASLYDRYETEKARRRVVDFDDLLWGLADALETDAEFAAVIRWRHRHLFVDEFQDVNPAQFRLIRLWLGDRRDLCVVGDDDQAVYGFTGADAGYPRSLRPPFPRRRPRPAGGELPVDPPGAGCGPRRPPRGAPAEEAPAADPARRSPADDHGLLPPTATRRRPWPGPCRAPISPGRPGPASPSSTAPTPSRRRWKRRCGQRGSPTGCGAPPGSSTGRRWPRPSGSCAGRRRPRRGSPSWPIWRGSVSGPRRWAAARRPPGSDGSTSTPSSASATTTSTPTSPIRGIRPARRPMAPPPASSPTW